MNNEVETNSRPLASNRLVSSEKKLQEKLWNSNFILLLQGQLVSVFGDSVYDVAFRFWILTTTGSTALMGIFMAITVLPKVFISPFAGTFIDRHDRKKVLIIADAISGITILFIGIATLTGFIKIWMAVIVSIIVGICGCFFNPTINSTIPDIVPKSKLIKANSAFSLISTGNEMIGNAFGGFLVQILGAPILFLVNGISFIFSSITECFLKIPKVESSSEKISFFQDLKEGIHFVKNSKGLKYLYITIAFLNFFASMSMTLTLPLFETNSNLGVGLYGIAMAINTFGMFLGFTFLSVFKIKRERQFYMFIASGVIASMTMITVSIFLNIYVISIMFFINGFWLAIMGSLLQLSMQSSVPSNIRSKVFAFKNTLSYALMPIAMVLAGILAEKIKINVIIFGDYVAFLILFIYLSLIPSVKEIINV